MEWGGQVGGLREGGGGIVCVRERERSELTYILWVSQSTERGEKGEGVSGEYLNMERRGQGGKGERGKEGKLRGQESELRLWNEEMRGKRLCSISSFTK